jgi:ABC-type branched-subunit amino acid transport system ATPase component
VGTVALLEIEGLRKTFGGLAAVDGIDLVLAEGALHALVGPNGCGKSTLFNLITGALRPASGRVRFAGQDITGWPVDRIARAGIGRKFQVPAVFDALTVAENLAVPRWSGRRLRCCGGRISQPMRPSSRGSIWRARVRCRPARSATASASGSRSACCWRHACACCCWTSPPPA